MIHPTRRGLIAGAASMTLPLAPTPSPGPPARLKVVVTGGHPGDPEYGCGGTVARLAGLGHEVVLLYLNDGEPAGPPRTGRRVAEATRAGAILGARPRFVGQVDGASVVDRAHADAFRAILEAERPDAVLTHWPIDNHADHRAMASLVLDAWLGLGRRSALYFYEVSNGEDTAQFAPTHLVDIDPAEPQKRAACFAHASQSPERFYALQDQVARLRGLDRRSGRAEGFVRHPQGPETAMPLGL